MLKANQSTTISQQQITKQSVEIFILQHHYHQDESNKPVSLCPPYQWITVVPIDDSVLSKDEMSSITSVERNIPST